MILRLTSIFLLLILMILISTSAEAICTRDSGAIVISANAAGDPPKLVNDTENGAGDQCSEIPDAYKIKFFKMGICTESPASLDLTSCSYMLESPAGVDHVIRMPNIGSLATGEFDIPVGTYGYMVAIMSNRFGINHVETFTENLRGLTGTGKTCWSIADKVTAYTNETVNNGLDSHDTTATDDAPSTNTLECGDAADADPGFSYEVINVFSDACSSWSGDMTGISMSNGTASAKLLKTDNTAAGACTNATRMLWVVALNSPIDVTKKSKFQLEFKLTDSVSVDMASDGSTDYAVKMGADPVTAILTTTEPD